MTELIHHTDTTPDGPGRALQSGGKFRNARTMHKMGLVTGLKLMWKALFAKPAYTVPAAPVPVRPLSRQQLLDAPDNTLFRLGHSTLLLKLNSQFWLTDPVFAERRRSASPSCRRSPA
jgi:hypothetical protein